MPHANERNIRRYWPIVYMAMDELGLDNSISNGCIPDLIDCLKKFKDYIAEEHWERIF